MFHRRATAVMIVVLGAFALGATACSSLSRSDEITISAEPTVGRAPPPAQAPAAQAPAAQVARQAPAADPGACGN